MQEVKRFWRSLEVLGGQGTMGEQWRRLVGEEFPIVRRFLRPTGALATWFPHDDPDLLYYRVVTHGPDDHVGVCDETGRRVVLRTADLVLEGLDLVVFHRALAAALGLIPAPRPIDHLRNTVRLGHYEPLAGYRFPTIFTIASREAELEQVIDRITALEEGPFLLLAPTRRFLRPVGEDLLRRRQAGFLALDESLGLDEHGQLAATPAARRAMQEFSAQTLPVETAEPRVAFFPTPAGSTWGQVKMHLVDGHTASIVVGTARGVYTYVQMGMANRKNGSPSVQWELLRTFAAGEGTLTWGSPGADRRNQKRREVLARQLRAFFRIEGDPIVSCGNGWQTRFQVGGPG
jgi:hypothetical protein